jgi:alkanesulfonate monooxygenase SsuD/methylene tetrahydromethanopterin reductase-like flavin-dependent oxidoreductase (luciferase family)
MTGSVREAPDPIGLKMPTDRTVAENLELAQYAERRGFDQVWQEEYRLARDAITPSAAISTVTDEIQVCIGIVPVWTRNPALIAQTMSTLEELAGEDRVVCGVGGWWEPIAEAVGVDWHRPLRATRETVESVRRLLDLETVTYDGDFVELDEVRIEVLHGSNDQPRTAAVYVGATGEKMLELTGHFADGCILNHLVDTAYNERALAAMERGARRAGRSLDAVDRSQMVYCSIDEDQDVALARMRRFVAQYAGQHPEIMERRGTMDPALVDAIADTVGGWPADEADVEAAMELIPEDVVRDLSATGTPEQVRRKVREYYESGVDVPVISALNADPESAVDVFADGYL